MRKLVILAYAGVLLSALAAWNALVDFGMFLVLAVACLSGIVALRAFALCRHCGKSLLVEGGHEWPRAPPQLPPQPRRLWWPEQLCSGCGRET